MDSSGMAFEFKNSRELFSNLLEEFDDHCRSPLKSRYAMNCAINGWHLTDWTYHDFFANDKRFQNSIKVDENGRKKLISGFQKYQGFVKKECKDLKYLQLIANGAKHFRLNDNSIQQKTELHEGEFSDEFSDEFDTSRFVIVLSESDKVDFKQTIFNVIEYWRNVLETSKQ